MLEPKQKSPLFTPPQSPTISRSGSLSPVRSNSPETRRSISKVQLLKKYNVEKVINENDEQSYQSQRKQDRSQTFQLSLKNIPQMKELDKELIHMQQIFEEFVQENKRKKEGLKNRKELTFENILERRQQDFQKMGSSEKIILNDEEVQETYKIDKIKAEQVFRDKLQQKKVSTIIQRTKNRLATNQLNKEQKFSKKFDVFKEMESFLEVKDLLQRLHKMDEENLDESKTNSRIFESRQNRMSALLEGVQKEQEINEEQDEYSKFLTQNTLLMKRVGKHLKKNSIFSQKVEDKKQLNNELLQLVQSELDKYHSQQSQKVHIGGDSEFQEGQMDRYMSELIKSQDILTREDLQKKTKKKKVENNPQISSKQLFVEHIGESADQVYKKFKEKSERVMTFLNNQSKQIYKQKQQEAQKLEQNIKPRRIRLFSKEGQERGNTRLSSSKSKKSDQKPFQRHNSIKKSGFYQSKEEVDKAISLPTTVRLESTKPVTKMKKSTIKQNKNVNLIELEQQQLRKLKTVENSILPLIVNKLPIRDFLQNIFDAADKVPRFHQKGDSQLFTKVLNSQFSNEQNIANKNFNKRLIRSISEAQQHIREKSTSLPVLKTNQISKKNSSEFQGSDVQSQPQRVNLPRISNDASFASDHSGSQGSYGSSDNSKIRKRLFNIYDQKRYHTDKSVKIQRKVIQLLIDRIEKTKETITKEKKAYFKRIGEIENNYEQELERFKPERVESLKYIEKQKQNMDFRKHTTFKKKKF